MRLKIVVRNSLENKHFAIIFLTERGLICFDLKANESLFVTMYLWSKRDSNNI